MGRVPTYITWFDEDEYIGKEICFEGLGGSAQSTWRLDQKVLENEYCESEEDVTAGIVFSEARAVFFCSTHGSDPSKAVIKIRMQIPWRGTATKPVRVRAKQAEENPTPGTMREIEALQRLTDAGCPSTPALYGWKQEKQCPEMWVPGGHIVYILMEKLPGINLRSFFVDLDRKERDQCREAFKKAWLECLAAGVVNIDSADRNLLWDRKQKKCYIIDFEHSCKSKKKDAWRNSLYIAWNLAIFSGTTFDDMSEWEL
ncbi:hypothetical protein FQN54_005521 [Arachnomyces sp. PD_36]|nr:hypothetical protein FQN54_005521 [Arachnomyces sp. PD_36]